MTAIATCRIGQLSGFVLPADGTDRRNHVRPPARRTAHYTDNFDRRTLIYDIVRQAPSGDLLITAPPLSNLWPLLRDGLRIDGQSPNRCVRLRGRGGKYDQVRLPKAAGTPSLQLHGDDRPLTARADIAAIFDGLNCAMALNKDNPLEWIRIWAVHHARLHGLQGVLIFDNQSDRYGLQDIADALSDVDGIQAVAVLSAPYPYGTTDAVEPREVRPNYLQPALLNLARTDILRCARAVLNADFDELVLARDGVSVFDAAARHWSGAARLPVYWAEPEGAGDGAQPQWRHTQRLVPKPRSPRKWCARPGGTLSRFGWHVHHVGGEIFKLLREDTAHEIVHCRATTTGWNPHKTRYEINSRRVPDRELDALWHRDGPA